MGGLDTLPITGRLGGAENGERWAYGRQAGSKSSPGSLVSRP
jgi:hypothetical protein